MRSPDLARALSREWSRINDVVFGGALLEPPTIDVSERLNHHLGEWVQATRTIRFSERYLSETSWWLVIELLKHEMAHQFVSDVLGIEDETSHGPAYRMICERYAIDGHAVHKSTAEDLRIVEKARKLLALTASTNQNEAEAALAAVQKLLGRHGLAEEDIRERSDLEFGALIVGPILATQPLHHVYVAAVLGEHFGVRPIWVLMGDPRTSVEGRQLELVGRRRDLAIAEYVHGWLHGVAERLCPPGLPKKGRLDFLAGVMKGHRERLTYEATSRKAEGEGLRTAIVTSSSMDSKLDDYFERRHPETRSLGRRSRRLGDSFFDGESAGRSLRMEMPIAAETGPKLLKK